MDFEVAGFLAGRFEVAEEIGDVGGFKMDANDFVIVAATVDGRPFDDVIGRRAHGIAHVSLLIDFLLARAGAAIRDKLLAREVFGLSAIDDVEEAEVDGVGEGDAEV